MSTFFKICNILPFKNLLKPTYEAITVPCRHTGKKFTNYPRKRFPPWLPKQKKAVVNEEITKENREFIQEVIQSKFPQPDIGFGVASPLKIKTIEPITEWQPHYRRVGVIARKLGIVPMWLKNGKKILTTMFQVVDNHVIKYIPPEEYDPVVTKRKNPRPRTLGSLVVGADSCDPQMFTKEYCGIFTESGVMPKKLLTRFQISPEAALQPGTPLFASHFKVGQFVDIRGKTIDRGFQGVMKRWGFKGMPATHGVTKTHRRPGNIGSGGNKARVMPGTKMPGHMGNRYRILRGCRIIRIDTKYNVFWIHGQSTAGETNSLVTVYDTLLKRKKCAAVDQVPYFPTYIPSSENEVLPDQLFVDDLHNFDDPTIMFKEE